MFHKTVIDLSWKLPFLRLRWLPSEESYRFATCLMSGGFATVEREFGCEDGRDWKPKEASRG
jgi:hypothetical protein